MFNALKSVVFAGVAASMFLPGMAFAGRGVSKALDTGGSSTRETAWGRKQGMQVSNKLIKQAKVAIAEYAGLKDASKVRLGSAMGDNARFPGITRNNNIRGNAPQKGGRADFIYVVESGRVQRDSALGDNYTVTGGDAQQGMHNGE